MHSALIVGTYSVPPFTETVTGVDVPMNGEAILDGESGLMIARRRLGNATFWVKFSREGEDAYIVHRAWSHRMNVVKREG